MPPRPRITQSGNKNRRSTDFQQPVGTGAVQSSPNAAPRPASSPNPAAAVLGQDPVQLTGEEKMLSFRDDHAVPASALSDPVFRFKTIRNAGELSIEGAGGRLFGQTGQIPTNYQMQRLGTSTIVSLKGGSIRTPEWEKGNKLRRALVRSEEALDKDPSNPQKQQAVARDRTAMDKSPLFDVEGGVGDFGKPFYAYQRQANGESLVQPGQQADATEPFIGPQQETFREEFQRTGEAEIGQTQFTGGVPHGPLQPGQQQMPLEVTGRGVSAGGMPTQFGPRGQRPPLGATGPDAKLARAEQLGLPSGSRPVTPGQEDAIKARLSTAKTTKQKEALLAALLKRGRNKDWSTSPTVMKLAEEQYKRGEPKRQAQQDQVDITSAFENLPPDRVAEMVDRLNRLFPRKILMKNRAYRQALLQYKLKAPKQRTGTRTEARKVAQRKDRRRTVENYTEFLIGKRNNDGDITRPGALQFETKIRKKDNDPRYNRKDGKVQTVQADEAAIAKQIWDAYEALQQEEDFVGTDRGDVLRGFEAALAKASRTSGAPDLSRIFRDLLRQSGQELQQNEQFVNEGAPPAGTPQAPEASATPQAAAQAPQGPRMGTSPIVRTVKEPPSDMPEFTELRFFTEKPDGSWQMYDEQKGVQLTIGKDGRRYYTQVVIRGGKQVSETTELLGNWPTPSEMQAAEEGGTGTATGQPLVGIGGFAGSAYLPKTQETAAPAGGEGAGSAASPEDVEFREIQDLSQGDSFYDSEVLSRLSFTNLARQLNVPPKEVASQLIWRDDMIPGPEDVKLGWWSLATNIDSGKPTEGLETLYDMIFNQGMSLGEPEPDKVFDSLSPLQQKAVAIALARTGVLDEMLSQGSYDIIQKGGKKTPKEQGLRSIGEQVKQHSVQ